MAVSSEQKRPGVTNGNGTVGDGFEWTAGALLFGRTPVGGHDDGATGRFYRPSACRSVKRTAGAQRMVDGCTSSSGREHDSGERHLCTIDETLT